jgi:hypothetical protein
MMLYGAGRMTHAANVPIMIKKTSFSIAVKAPIGEINRTTRRSVTLLTDASVRLEVEAVIYNGRVFGNASK